MDKFGKAQALNRVEDVRFLTGAGRYVDDTAPEGALFAFFFRSPVAHAQITSIGLDDARAAPGVAAIVTAQDIDAAGMTDGLSGTQLKNLDGTKGAGPLRPFLARGRVRFVGEPVALVVAETLQAAKDAAELIEFDYEDLTPHLGLETGGAQIHEEAPDNIAFHWGMGDKEATDKAFAEAAHRVSLRIDDNRIIVNSMEPRGAWAQWGADGRLTFSVNGQGVWGQKSQFARSFGIDESMIRVLNPDVGGGFGMKAFDYPEHHALALAAKMTGKPVRWMAERTEAMLSDNAGRDLYSDAELAFDADNKITAYRCKNLSNLGAYNSGFAQAIQSSLFAMVFAGTYDIKAGWLECVGIYTNTTPVDAYRGAGRPEAIYTLERMMDFAARELGESPWDLRRKNFIAPDAFPYTTVTNVTYDCGDFRKVLARVESEADVAGFPARKAAAQAEGKLLGLGLCYYIESILGDPTEGATIEFTEDGEVNLYVGTQSNGQGHETVFAAVLAERIGVPVAKIKVIQGDSDRIAKGGGTGGSRSATVQSTATLAVAETMIEAYKPFVAAQLGGDEASFDPEEGVFRVPGSNQTPNFLEAAEMARDQDRDDLLRTSGEATLKARSFPNGAHVAEIEIDPQTGVVEVKKYTVTDDFGNLLNPRLAEGQVHGGVVQGIGQAITERTVYDDEGQLLTATFMDYAMPRADNAPMIAFYSEPTPTEMNPFGMKGCGEAGTVGALAAVTNGVLDACWDLGLRQVDMPFTPHRMWQMLQSAEPIAAE